MSEPATFTSLGEAIEYWLPKIDESLHGTPISQRCMSAAFLFVENFLLKVEGDTKDGFHEKPWFKPIYQAIRAWYEKHYGEALAPRREPLNGVCLIRGVAFQLQVPRTLSQVEKEGETAWLIFPTERHASEQVSDWIVKAPNLALFLEDDRKAILENVERIGSQLRRIYVDCAFADAADDVAHEMVAMIIPHLSAGAGHLTAHGGPTSPGLACWESHQAVEKALKVLARQQSGKHLFDHELRELRAAVASSGLQLPDDALLDRIPNKADIIRLRGGEEPVGIHEAYDVYRACLEATMLCARLIARKYEFSNFSLLLKKPPFVG